MAHWVSTWGQAHTNITYMSPQYKNCTMRLVITNCLEGSKVRLRVSNQEGKKNFAIQQASIRNGNGPALTVTFSGKREKVLKVGQEMHSDPISLEVKPGDLLVISMAFRGKVTSGNGILECVQCSKKGNFVETLQFETVHRSKTACYHDMIAAIPALSSVEVLTREDAGAVVCFGDSIVQQSAWTKPLMEEFLARRPGKLTVINKGIGGNRLLNDSFMPFGIYGRAGTERFDRDVLDEAGTQAVIVAIGTNDIAMGRNSHKQDWVTAEMLQLELYNLVQKCRKRNIVVYGTTILPRTGSTGYSNATEMERIRFNNWVRTTNLFDGIIDFDKQTRDESMPNILAFAYDSGDHLHPHNLGGKRMAKLAAEELLKDCRRNLIVQVKSEEK